MLLIRHWRLKRGKSMAWLAETLGVSVKTVSHWERGDRQPHPSMIPRIATALGITPGSLFPKHWHPEEVRACPVDTTQACASP